MSSPPLVGIVMGSPSDWDVMRNTSETLAKFDVPCESKVLSAHRTPDRLADYVKAAQGRGIKVIIAGAGMAAALPGAVAALTPLPVLGVPMEANSLGGLDAMLAMVQMPRGVPVGTLAVGKAGAMNAALMAVAILALSDDDLAAAYDAFREEQSQASDQVPDAT
jgi:5-(carboxyamino)imidazole ribonucleotide mutase